jgi:hypothetical protein
VNGDTLGLVDGAAVGNGRSGVTFVATVGLALGVLDGDTTLRVTTVGTAAGGIQ